MKRTILIVAIVLLSTVSFSSFAAYNTLKGNTTTKFGSYTLTPATNMVVIDDVAYKTWNLAYSGSQEQYQVIYSPGLNGECCFIVRNDKFEIQYKKQSNKFGVKLVDTDKRTLKKKEVMTQINYDQFVSQLVLTANNKTEEEYLGLVACFMPLLFG